MHFATVPISLRSLKAGSHYNATISTSNQRVNRILVPRAPTDFKIINRMKRVPIWKMDYWSKVCGFSVLPWRRKLTQTSMWLLALFFLLGDEKFELAVINPGLILGPVLHGSTCTSMEVQITCIILSSSRRSSVDRFAERMLLHTLLNGTNCCSLFRILNGVAVASSLSTLLFISPLGNSSCRLQIPYQNGSWNNKD